MGNVRFAGIWHCEVRTEVVKHGRWGWQWRAYEVHTPTLGFVPEPDDPGPIAMEVHGFAFTRWGAEHRARKAMRR